MAFGGTFGPSAALLPVGIIFNILGEVGDSYDADGNIAFKRASGSVYTPERVDTLLITGQFGGGGQGTPPLGILQLGPALAANLDTGQLVTDVAVVNQHGLPANFGPGRGNWSGTSTGNNLPRLRIEAAVKRTIIALPAGQGGIEFDLDNEPGDNVSAIVRNMAGEAPAMLRLTVECVHSIQG